MVKFSTGINFIQSVSSSFVQQLNTISLQFSGEAAVQEKLEDIRVAVSRSSPMMEVVNLVWLIEIVCVSVCPCVCLCVCVCMGYNLQCISQKLTQDCSLWGGEEVLVFANYWMMTD